MTPTIVSISFLLLCQIQYFGVSGSGITISISRQAQTPYPLKAVIKVNRNVINQSQTCVSSVSCGIAQFKVFVGAQGGDGSGCWGQLDYTCSAEIRVVIKDGLHMLLTRSRDSRIVTAVVSCDDSSSLLWNGVETTYRHSKWFCMQPLAPIGLEISNRREMSTDGQNWEEYVSWSNGEESNYSCKRNEPATSGPPETTSEMSKGTGETNTGLIIGLTVTAVVIVIIVVLVIIFISRRRRKRRSGRSTTYRYHTVKGTNTSTAQRQSELHRYSIAQEPQALYAETELFQNGKTQRNNNERELASYHCLEPNEESATLTQDSNLYAQPQKRRESVEMVENDLYEQHNTEDYTQYSLANDI